MMADPFVVLVVELAILLALASLLGHAAQRLGFPAIVGELMAGILLGQTVLGALLPSGFALLFPTNATVTEVRSEFLKVGLLLFIFLVGLEVNPAMLGRHLRTILPTSILGMAIPFAVGFGSVVALPNIWYGSPTPHSLTLPLMIGVALSVSALPVIARIMIDLGLIQTDIGRIILSSAIVDDLAGWLAFALLISSLAPAGASSIPVWRSLVTVLITFALALTVGRRVGAQVWRWVQHRHQQAGLVLALVLALALLTSGLMENVGVHAFFGALTVGLAFSAFEQPFFEPVARIVRFFFTPLYFGAVGISVNFLANFDVALVLLVIGIAAFGKLVGVTLGARLGGLPTRDAFAIAIGMNARGAVEILLATLARQSGLIDDRIFVALITMALTTSVLAGSLLRRVLGVSPPAELVRSTEPVLQRLDPSGSPFDEIEIGQRLTIGRAPINRLMLADDELTSGEHAAVRRVDGQYRLEDLGSKNGTLLWRGMRWLNVAIEELAEGDIFVIGSNVFRFSRGTLDAES